MRLQVREQCGLPVRRRGVAPLEFVMVLPFLVILAGILFTMAHANLIKGEAIQQARNEAWHKRYGHGADGSLPLSGASQAEKLAGLTRGPAFSGLKSGTGTSSANVQRLAPASRYFLFAGITAHATHEVFSGPWDHETIPFESHAPLGLDTRVRVYAFRADTLGSLADHLRLFGSLMNAIKPSDSPPNIGDKIHGAVTTVDAKIDELNREIRQLEDDLRNLRERLRMAVEKADVQQIQRQIDRAEQILQKLREAKEKLQMGKNLGPTP